MSHPRVTIPQTIRVDLADRSHEIQIVSNEATGFAAFARAAFDATRAGGSSRFALVITDRNVLPHAEMIQAALSTLGLATELEAIEPGEESKSFETAIRLFDRLVDCKADRHAWIVAVGGGVVGDLAGYVAATYARGLPLLMVPTSLLAMVDSSVGGKVGINHPRAKNIIGAFHQPVGVWIDTSYLATLPTRELRCGLAEIIKYGMILDAGFFNDLEVGVESVLARDPQSIRHVIARSCELKARVVSADEREETGLRAVLNFGHTIGHAIEAVAGYGGLFEHGEAVAAGMVAECRLAERIGWIDARITDRLISLLRRCELPISAPGLSVDTLFEAMGRDKKNQAGKIRFVLPRRIGQVELTDTPTRDQVEAVLVELANSSPSPRLNQPEASDG